MTNLDEAASIVSEEAKREFPEIRERLKAEEERLKRGEEVLAKGREVIKETRKFLKQSIWIRLGDVAEYEKFDTPYDAGIQVGERVGIGKVEPMVFYYRAAGVSIPPSFTGDNYVSLFLGDEDAQWIRDLSNIEKRQFEDGVQEGITL